MGRIKTAQQIENIRISCQKLARLFDALKDVVVEGQSLIEIDHYIEDQIKKEECKPAFKGWNNFPNASCLSVNEIVIHGIPNAYRLQKGDIIGVDIGMIYKGGYSDAAYTFRIPPVDPEVEKLCQITEQCLYLAIEQARTGHRIGDISHAVQKHAEANGYSLVREYCGHGVGESVWEEPQIPNVGRPNLGPRLKPNMVIAIEPMVNLGKHPVKVLKDTWTVVTKDKKPSAHFEHTILITHDDPEILTKI